MTVEWGVGSCVSVMQCYQMSFKRSFPPNMLWCPLNRLYYNVTEISRLFVPLTADTTALTCQYAIYLIRKYMQLFELFYHTLIDRKNNRIAQFAMYMYITTTMLCRRCVDHHNNNHSELRWRQKKQWNINICEYHSSYTLNFNSITGAKTHNDAKRITVHTINWSQNLTIH